MTRIRDTRLEAACFRRRALIGFAAAMLGVLLLAARFFFLQVASYSELQTRSEANRVKLRPVVPARGLIFDRHGRLLADNVPAFRLELVPEQVKDIPATLDALSAIVPLDAEERGRFQDTLRVKRRFQPVPVKLRLSEEEVARFAVQRYRFPGVDVVPYLMRRYPYGSLFAHIVGYVGRVDADELAGLDPVRYGGVTHIGKSGIERRYEDRLHGEAGSEQIEVNAEGRALRVLERHSATPGTHLYLTLDADLQAAGVAAFEGQPGAAVAVDPRNGEVLALVSLPSFDANLFANGISHEDYAVLTADPSQPLFNRAVSGGYEPGSTLKPFMGLAGLELGLRTPESTVLSTGTYRLSGQDRDYRDWRRGGHGRVDLKEALAQSVNTYFYDLAVEAGVDRLSHYLARFGFGALTGIDLVGESTGVLPSREWKRAKLNQPWYPGETVIFGIGQGFWVATPLQLAQAISVLAANGMRHPLHLLRATRQGFDEAIQRQPPPPETKVVDDPSHLDTIRAGMVAVMHSPAGTARQVALGSPYHIAGKTGTAQRVSRTGSQSVDVNTLPFHLRHRALFIAYAPAENPEIAVAVVLEHGGSGSKAAAPVARRILDAWILRQRTEDLSTARLSWEVAP